MKLKRTPWYFTALIALSFVATVRTTYSGQVANNSNPPLRLTYSSSPLLVNNQSLNPALLSTVSRGILTVVSADPASEKTVRIPFRVYIKREGEIIDNSLHQADQSVIEIDLKNVLTVARPGDWLIIEPVRKEDRVPRHTLLLKSPVYLWLLSAGQQGC